MRYIDSKTRSVEHTVAHWMNNIVGSACEVRCQTGYFTFEGASVLLPALKRAIALDGVARIVLGSNRGSTVAQHVELLFECMELPRKKFDLGIMIYDTSLFHPKVYHFKLEGGRQCAYVGSSNLTGPGLTGLNLEAGILLDTDDNDSPDLLDQISTSIDAWFADQENGLYRVTKLRHVQDLLEKGFLSSKKDFQRGDPLDEVSIKLSKRPGTRTGVKLDRLYKIDWRGDATNLISPEKIRHRGMAEQSLERFKNRTEASYHYPQGTHLGHFLLILQSLENGQVGTPYDQQFVRMSGGLAEGRLGRYQRQVKYKLAAAMELGLINDIRLVENRESYSPELTEDGRQFWSLLKGYVAPPDLEVSKDDNGIYSAKLKGAEFYVDLVRKALIASPELEKLYDRLFLRMPAAVQMLRFLYYFSQKTVVRKNEEIYDNFFKFRPVVDFCRRMRIPASDNSGSSHRCPFLLGLLAARGILTISQYAVHIDAFAVSASLLATEESDTEKAQQLVDILVAEWDTGAKSLPDEDRIALKEAFGSAFLTDSYHLKKIMQIEN